MTPKRSFQPCRVCGKTHSNPRSCSICDTCGAAEAAAKALEREEEEQRSELYAASLEIIKHGDLERAETVEDLRRWIKEYLL